MRGQATFQLETFPTLFAGEWLHRLVVSQHMCPETLLSEERFVTAMAGEVVLCVTGLMQLQKFRRSKGFTTVFTFLLFAFMFGSSVSQKAALSGEDFTT